MRAVIEINGVVERHYTDAQWEKIVKNAVETGMYSYCGYVGSPPPGVDIDVQWVGWVDDPGALPIEQGDDHVHRQAAG